VRPGKRPRMIAVQSADARQSCALLNRAKRRVRCGRTQRPSLPACACKALRRLHHAGNSARIGWRGAFHPDEQILASLKDWAKNEGIFLSPEGAAATAAYDHLLSTGYLKPEDRVVIFNTGADSSTRT